MDGGVGNKAKTHLTLVVVVEDHLDGAGEIGVCDYDGFALATGEYQHEHIQRGDLQIAHLRISNLL